MGNPAADCRGRRWCPGRLIITPDVTGVASADRVQSASSSLEPRMSPISIYLHIPFCTTRCAYCDFNTYAGLENLIPAYVASLAKEIRGVGGYSVPPRMPGADGKAHGPSAHSVYFGGGTPSLLSVDQVAQILEAIRDGFGLLPGSEITLEANPGSVDLALLEGYRRIGVNRLSLGVQSSHPGELRLLERGHTFPDVIQAVLAARKAGFTNVSLDLIFGLPYQTITAWKESLLRALSLDPDHVSLYALSLEFGTPMHAWVGRGLLPEPDPDLAAEMYARAASLLDEGGFQHYEISNWAGRSGSGEGNGSFAACRHNLQYWRNRPYLGFGAGAHGYAAGVRYANVRSPSGYVRRIEAGAGYNYPVSPAVADQRDVPLSTEMNETMMLGLRLLDEGVDESAFKERFGVGIEEAFPKPMKRLQEDGLVRWDEGHLRLTESTIFIANQAFCLFV